MGSIASEPRPSGSGGAGRSLTVAARKQCCRNVHDHKERSFMFQTRRFSSPLRLEELEARRLLNAGDLDPTFGVGGKVLTDFVGPIDAAAVAAVVQTDG